MLTPAHGWVAATVVGSWLVHHGFMAVTVVNARKKYSVKYPDLYATAENCKNEDHRAKFNGIQRGHQNALENQPIFLTLLLTAGYKFPLTAAVAGGVYLIGRLLYQWGYSSGNPDGRSRGFLPMYGGMLTLVGASIRVAYEMIRGNV